MTSNKETVILPSLLSVEAEMILSPSLSLSLERKSTFRWHLKAHLSASNFLFMLNICFKIASCRVLKQYEVKFPIGTGRWSSISRFSSTLKRKQ